MPNLGPTELLIIAFVVILLFGSRKLPDAARSFGRSLRIFKAETKGLSQDEQAASSAAPAQQQEQAAPRPIEAGQPAVSPQSASTGTAHTAPAGTVGVNGQSVGTGDTSRH
ncbi:Sec-independent protein translocase subunit TatA [Candidatus Protofrankia californiensis]|uniref:Sec-independent protein translocase subunit TatA n=1 Tax=Candidatus Protofrankia californiensis TaxID=1839754 RepID=UPI001040FAC8|nr:Sec-independent protein translocase subunit TatA [Candidatus Protofrankia californiensis]